MKYPVLTKLNDKELIFHLDGKEYIISAINKYRKWTARPDRYGGWAITCKTDGSTKRCYNFNRSKICPDSLGKGVLKVLKKHFNKKVKEKRVTGNVVNVSTCNLPHHEEKVIEIKTRGPKRYVIMVGSTSLNGERFTLGTRVTFYKGNRHPDVMGCLEAKDVELKGEK